MFYEAKWMGDKMLRSHCFALQLLVLKSNADEQCEVEFFIVMMYNHLFT